MALWSMIHGWPTLDTEFRSSFWRSIKSLAPWISYSACSFCMTTGASRSPYAQRSLAVAWGSHLPDCRFVVSSLSLFIHSHLRSVNISWNWNRFLRYARTISVCQFLYLIFFHCLKCYCKGNIFFGSIFKSHHILAGLLTILGKSIGNTNTSK